MTYEQELLKAAYTYMCRLAAVSTTGPEWLQKRVRVDPMQILIPFNGPVQEKNDGYITGYQLRDLIKKVLDYS